VRGATHDDVPRIAAAVHELLHELGATPPPALAMQAAARALLDDPAAGALLVAQAGAAAARATGGVAAGARPGGAENPGAIVGVLGCSWPTAIHAVGGYALIEDLWVHPAWRGQGVGGGLLEALYALAHERAVARVEVGLPTERYAGLPETEAFYLAHGFAQLSARMRRALP
jgi:GNAT superfamily N-acetyltransferase